jgi:hypothetical protein
MGRADELEAELEVVKLEEHLVALKADAKAGDADLRRVKLALREARLSRSPNKRPKSKATSLSTVMTKLSRPPRKKGRCALSVASIRRPSRRW